MQKNILFINATRTADWLTCVHSLPTNGERCPSLNNVARYGAAVVPSGRPGQLCCAVCDFLHGNFVRRARRAWKTDMEQER